MTNEQFFFTLFCTVFFCLGLSKTSSEGYFLFFLRKPFLSAGSRVDFYEEKVRALRLGNTSEKIVGYYQQLIFWNNLVCIIGNPLILCITCMASIWGITVFVTLNGFTSALIPYLILNCFSASFIQTFIWDLYVKYVQ